MPTDLNATAERFTAALNEAEGAHDPAPLLPLFHADADLGSVAKPDPVSGADGARQFWTDYLSAFGSIHSEFTSVRAGGNLVVLEWVSEGTLPAGKPIRYRGVSVLDVEGDLVKRFRTYYDSAAFVAPTADAAPAGEPDSAQTNSAAVTPTHADLAPGADA
jgi:ketosteroid isomerase-like protein